MPTKGISADIILSFPSLVPRIAQDLKPQEYVGPASGFKQNKYNHNSGNNRRLTSKL
jgi:hypothetical protein